MPLLPSPFSPSPPSPSPIHSHKPKTLIHRRLTVTSRRSDSYDPQRFPSSSPPLGEGEVPSSRVFTGYSIYKGKAVLAVVPKAPEFAPLNTGAYKLSKEGMVLLQFAPAFATRQYDWNRKQIFSLSVAEIGTLMSLGARDSCEFYHDPLKGKSEEGKIRKILKVEPLSDGSGHFFNLSVQNRIKNLDENVHIPITRPEFTVLNSVFNFIIPYLLGWHAFANSIKPENSIQPNNTRFSAELEWNR